MEVAPPEAVPGFGVPVHRALTEHILLGGAPRGLAIANATLSAAIGLGLRLWIAGVVIFALGHMVSVWAARRDPQFVDVARRHLRLAERTLTGLAVLLQSQALKQSLAPYCIGGPFGRLLDAESEHLGEASFQAFETEGLTGSAAAPAVLSYLFHRIEGRLDGSPTMIIIDEGWLVLDSPAFAARLREWLKTLRKKNASVVFATQSLADIETSAIAPAIIESCPTRIFLPNDRAVEPQILAIYRRFGLNDRQIEIIARATPKRDYYCQSARGNRLFELGLGEVALAFTATSSKADQLEIDAITAAHGCADFAARWLRHRGLAWATELLPAPSPLPQPGPQPGPLPDQPQE